MPTWLVTSIVLSIVLTVVLNLVPWLFPGAGQRLGAVVRRATERIEPPTGEPGSSRVRVVFPWRLMLVASVLLTVAINVLIRLLR